MIEATIEVAQGAEEVAINQFAVSEMQELQLLMVGGGVGEVVFA